MIKLDSAYLMFATDATDEQISRRFAERFGHSPDDILRDERGAWAGPITIEEEHEARRTV